MTEKTIRMRATDDPPRCRKPKPLVNPSVARARILASLQKRRPELAKQITRVSPEAIQLLEGYIINRIDQLVDSVPSVGKTFKP